MNRPTPKISPARRLALAALLAVSRKQARVEEVLARRLAQASLSEADRALATEIVYGVCRWRGRLDHYLAHFSKRPLHKLSPEVLTLLRLGAHQILNLSRIPARAAVDTTVELARSRGPKWTAGYVNGVLRALAEGADQVSLPDPAADRLGHLATAHSHPAWLVSRWVERLGDVEAEALLQANNAPPVLTLRSRPLAGERQALTARLEAAGLAVRPGEYSPQAVLVSKASLTRLAQLAPNLFVAQSEAAQLVALTLAPRPGWRVWDMCAGAGGKTTHLAELMSDQGLILAQDKDPGRLAVNQGLVQRLGLRAVRFRLQDALRPLERALESEAFDAVLVDAPCSGTGALRSRPDVRWRLRPEGPERLGRLQLSLLKRGAEMVRPDGVLVYATCSLLEEENEAVVQRFLSARRGFQIDDPAPHLPPAVRGLVNGDGFVATWPHRHHLDGFFIARLVRRQ